VAGLPIRVLLGHRLSNGHQVLFNRGQAVAIDLEPLEAHVRFAADEFAQIARAPISPNANLLRGIRSLKDAFEWPSDQVAALGGVLSENAALTTEEYAWLREDW
jgi:hypothetical protein